MIKQIIEHNIGMDEEKMLNRHIVNNKVKWKALEDICE